MLDINKQTLSFKIGLGGGIIGRLQASLPIISKKNKALFS